MREEGKGLGLTYVEHGDWRKAWSVLIQDVYRKSLGLGDCKSGMCPLLRNLFRAGPSKVSLGLSDH